MYMNSLTVESPIAQWLECSSGIWKVMGLVPVEELGKTFFRVFDLRTRLHLFHFIQVTISLFNSYAKVKFYSLKVGDHERWP